MQKLLALMAAGLLSASFAGSAMAQFEEYDANDDSYIGEEEFSELGDERFSAYDADGDGIITEEEFAETEFSAYDEDDDDLWSEEEFTAYEEDEGLFTE